MTFEKQVPLFRNHREGPVREALGEALERVLDNGFYVLGKQVELFEEMFAKYCGVSHCVSLANGTDALELALRAVGVLAGDRVALVANAGFYGSAAVYAIGATPVYVEVDAQTLTMCPQALQRALSEHSLQAILVTHLYGRLAAIEEIVSLAGPVPVVEDCAQAHGARRRGRTAGSFARAGCFSFYPTKNLGALGDGGCVVSDDAGLALRIRELRQYGWSEKYTVMRQAGRNSRLDELQAAALLVQLPHLDGWNFRRREVANWYRAGLGDLPLQLPHWEEDTEYVAHLFVIRCPDRDRLRERLRRQGVASAVHYPIADFDQPAYPVSAHLPVTSSACRDVLTLPCFPGLTAVEAEQVVEAVRKSF